MKLALLLAFGDALVLPRSAPRSSHRPSFARSATESKRTLHPLSPVIKTEMVDVGGGHTVYYELRGNANSTAPVALFLHGGPGAGCYPNHARFFDPKKWRVLLLDQRGCGRSTPQGEWRENTTPLLIDDLELLRSRLGVEQWGCVLGGSWGSTLALAYAQLHPRVLRSMVLRGVCTMRANEIDWLFAPKGGMSQLAPKGWADFAKLVEADEPVGATDSRKILEAYHKRLTGGDRALRDSAARAWSSWESSASAVTSRRGVAKFVSPNWRFEARGDNQCASDVDSLYGPPARLRFTSARKTNATASPAASQDYAPAQQMLTCHYSVHNGFLEDGALLLGSSALRHIPAIAVQGGADTICPPATAFELHRYWPELELRLVTGAGHSQYDPDITHELLEATDACFDRISTPTSRKRSES
ncbi:Alpha/Beta hydrolase protein [Pelagophyceae sp. CCMP2097]|nr:Alpha/Beta hydrolase protein [Pelagophyceae sp. CCMP2097]